LPVLDGLDEMDPDTGSPRRATAAVERVNTYLRGQAPSPVVVTCRAHRYQQLTKLRTRPTPATDVTIDELDAAQVRAYLRAQLRDLRDKHAWQQVLDYLAAPDSPH